MIRVAAGEPLGLRQADVTFQGWAIESRIYAEDPYRGFLPSIGRLVRYEAPAEGKRDGGVVRNDTGVREGDEISIFYDPMIAKLSAWGPDRPAAIRLMARALEDFDIQGVGHNTPFLSAVVDQERFGAGELSTDYIPEEFPHGFSGLAPTPWQSDLMIAVACYMHQLLADRAMAALEKGAPARSEWVVIFGDESRRVGLAEGDHSLKVELLDVERRIELDGVKWRPGLALFRGRLEGQNFTASVGFAPEGFRIRHRAASALVLVLTAASAELHRRLPPKSPPDTSRLVICPMPGLVVSMDISVGDEISQGQVLCVIEAMKMQNIIRAERDGVVKAIGAAAGESVAADDVLAELA
jgi:propionyl-CoA carboxylase alpha chain